MSRRGTRVALIKRPINDSIEKHGSRARGYHANDHQRKNSQGWPAVRRHYERCERERKCENRMRETNQPKKSANPASPEWLHVFAAVCIIAMVLVQQGKGATMGAAFGAGASQTVFGSRGSGSFLFRITISFVAIFFITSITLNYMTMRAYKQEKAFTLQKLPMPEKESIPVKTAPVSTPEQIPLTNSTVPKNK